MKCPCCHIRIPNELILKYVASLNGKKSKRTLTPEQAKAMVEAGKRKKNERC